MKGKRHSPEQIIGKPRDPRRTPPAFAIVRTRDR